MRGGAADEPGDNNAERQQQGCGGGDNGTAVMH
jgi:hypothetical protein